MPGQAQQQNALNKAQVQIAQQQEAARQQALLAQQRQDAQQRQLTLAQDHRHHAGAAGLLRRLARCRLVRRA